MHLLHTEASLGWGGQEIRILKEAEGMRERGHTLYFATAPGALLAQKAREAGFVVEEIPFSRSRPWACLPPLIQFIRRYQIDIVNTHSSKDAWMAGLAARLCGRKILRTRHLSATIRSGWNSKILYGKLADGVVTTCSSIAEVIRRQAGLPKEICVSIPTGVDTNHLITYSREEIQNYRATWGIAPNHFVAGTLCVLRSWKGISDLIQAAHRLRHLPTLKWLVVGEGPCGDRYREEAKRLNLEKQVIFTGYDDNPIRALAAMDLFLLLSTANEGVSQASVQASILGKPLITTPVGGLPEVCIHDKTGFVVPANCPEVVATRVAYLYHHPDLRKKFGAQAETHARERFTFDQTLDGMEAMYQRILKPID